MKPRLSLPGLLLQSFSDVRVNGQYRYESAMPDKRQGESCTVLRLARPSPKEPALALIEFADGRQHAVRESAEPAREISVDPTGVRVVASIAR